MMNIDKNSFKIALLLGGWNKEAEVSIESGSAIYDSLIRLGYKNVTKINFTKDSIYEIQKLQPDLVFSALHGEYFEDGRLQGMMDICGFKYTHSGFWASCIGMNKNLTKEIAGNLGIKTAKGFMVTKKYFEENRSKVMHDIKNFPKPFVVKPNLQGSSVGVVIVHGKEEFNIAFYDWKFGDEILVEEFIKGRELTIAIVNGKAIGGLWIKPKNEFYDYNSKYKDGSEYIEFKEKPAIDVMLKNSEDLYNAIGCRSIARCDFILSNENVPYLLEINTNPGMTSHSLVPKIAGNIGMSYDDVIQSVIDNAIDIKI